MQLSQRLLAVADLASAGHCLADVGTDHGYIPIYLMEKGNYERAIAMDVRKGPLLRAEENRKSHGFEDRMDLRLSDGVAALREGEADTVVIALGTRALQDQAEAFRDCAPTFWLAGDCAEGPKNVRHAIRNGYDAACRL